MQKMDKRDIAKRREIDGRIMVVVDVTESRHAQVMKAVEAEYFKHALEAADGCQTRAARFAGLQYRTFRNRLAGLALKLRVVVE